MVPTFSLSRGTDYAYAYGRIGVLQQRLLTGSDIDRLIGAKDLQELKNIFSELPLTASVTAGIENVEELLPAMEHWLHKEVDSMVDAPENHVFDILWLREDAPMISYLLKQYKNMATGSVMKQWNTVTAYDVESLQALVKDAKQGNLPEHLIHFIQRIKAENELTPVKIDAEVAQYIAQTQTTLAEESGSRYIQKYVAQLIDLQNIRTFQRLRPEDSPLEHLLQGGSIQPQRFPQDKRKLISLLRGAGFHFASAEALESSDDSAASVERSLMRAIAHELAEMRGIPLSVEAVFAFAIVILSQLRVLRTIIVAKSAGLSPEEIRDMLPPFLSTSPYEA